MRAQNREQERERESWGSKMKSEGGRERIWQFRTALSGLISVKMALLACDQWPAAHSFLASGTRLQKFRG